MINGRKVLAIIPARAGSKRVKDKNIRNLGGIPLIGWSLKDLKKSKFIDHAFVSTDSFEIQDIAKKYNIDCEPLRPASLATDTSKTMDVVLNILREIHKDYDIIVLLQPTSPFRKIEDVDLAINSLVEREAEAVISVCETEVHPSWTLKLDENNDMRELVKNIKNSRSQDLEKYYQLNGAIYVAKKDALFREETFFLESKTFAYVMTRMDSIDIDTEQDLILAEVFALKRFSGPCI